MVLADSRRFSRSRRYLGNPTGGCVRFGYGAVTLCGAPFQNASPTQQLGNSVMGLVPRLSVPTTPHRQRHQALTPARFRLFPFRSPLLRESRLLSFPQGTEMFQFPWFPLPALCVQTGVTPHDGCRVSPFGHPRIKAWSTAPRGFSQSPTSFIGSRRQGIHRWLFVAWKNIQDARARSAVLKGRAHGKRGRQQRLASTARQRPSGSALPHNGRENSKSSSSSSSRGRTFDDSKLSRTNPPVHQLGNA